MAFCSKCGAKVASNADFCPKCGGKIKEEAPPKEEPKETKPEEKPIAQTAPSGGGGSKAGWACGICGILFAVGLVIFVILGILALSFIGAKGQPGTVIPATEVKTPLDLKTSETDNSIDLAWKKSATSDVKKYNVYKSDKNGKDYKKVSTIENATLAYKDTAVTKGITYYYVVTAVDSGGKESGNSNQAAGSLTAPPIIPEGVTSWQDVLTKYNADQKYADVLTKVTKLTKSDIEKYVDMEKKGKKMKTTLKKGTVITNTTENYKIIPKYVLPKDKEFLTDDKGNPHIMMLCGNPIKLIKKQNWVANTVQAVQNITYNIIYVFPAPVTNIFINAAQPLSTVVINIFPNTFGPTMEDPDRGVDETGWDPGDILIDTAEDLGVPSDVTGDLEAGQQWAVEGEILLEANPHDPGPGESVNMTIKIFPAQAGVDIEYHVSGTDGYSDNGTKQTDAEGKIEFHIPGGAEGVSDTITVKVPSTGKEGSTTYTF